MQLTPDPTNAPAAEMLSDARLVQMKEQLLVSDAVVGELIDADDVRGLIARAEKAEAQLTDQAEAERQLLLRDEENRKLEQRIARLLTAGAKAVWALEASYDATEWPANGETQQDKAAASLRAAMIPAADLGPEAAAQGKEGEAS